MRILLDTHILLWWLNDDARLNSGTRELLADPENVLFISAASTWEIYIKMALGKLQLPENFHESLGGFEKLAVSVTHTVELQRLPSLHQDPFDRILLAQARCEKLLLLSTDRELLAYGHPVLAG